MTYFFFILTVIGQYLPSVLGYNLLFGRGKMMYFGPIAVAIVASYAFAIPWVATGNFLLAIACSAAFSIAISLVFALLSLRLESDAFGVMTLAVFLAFIAIVMNWISLTGGPYGIAPIPRLQMFRDPGVFAMASLLIGIGFAVVMWFLDRSKIGRALEAFAEHPWCASSLGLCRTRTVIIAFLIASVGPVLSNMLYLQLTGILHPSDYMFPTLVFAMTCVVAGGPGSVVGVTIATALLVTLREGIRFLPLPVGLVGPLRLFLFGTILLTAIYLRRKKLFPLRRTV
jgi:branched-chain amino acid transport system permease protein